MVKLLLVITLLFTQAPLAAADTSADPAISLEKFHPEPNSPFEDFFTVSLVSLPFTTLWSFVGATTVAALSQQKFPPEYNDQLLIGAGSTALGLSLGIGLFSISWGAAKAPALPLPKGNLP